MRFRRLLQAAACLGNGKTSLSPKLTPLLTVSLVLGCMVCSPAAARPDCASWNSTSFFEEASVDDVNRCLSEGVDPNIRARDGWTPLRYTIVGGDNQAIMSKSRAEYSKTLAMVQTLLDAGADPNTRTRNGSTLLHRAVFSSGAPAVVQALLAAGADPNAEDKDRETPLHVAVKYTTWLLFDSLFDSKTLAVVQALLDAGADPNAEDKDIERRLFMLRLWFRQ